MNVIEVESLSKTFQIKNAPSGIWGHILSVFRPELRTINAVTDISFSVREGEIVAFVGPNGAGKSTTLKMLSGILLPTKGSCRVLGLNPFHDRRSVTSSIGVIFGQRSQLSPSVTVMDSLWMAAGIYGVHGRDYSNRVEYLSDALGLHGLLETPARKLSLGQRMRCELAMSLMHSPRILFLDEPSIGLDIISKGRLRECIVHLNKTEGVTVILTSHDVGDIEHLSNRTIIINEGVIVVDSETSKIRQSVFAEKLVEITVCTPAGLYEKSTMRIENSPLAIQTALRQAVERDDIHDINIFDPPMEDVIRKIYETRR